jgi:hypothetical protein
MSETGSGSASLASDATDGHGLLATTTFRATPVFWLAFLLIGLVGLWWALRLSNEILAAEHFRDRWHGFRQMRRLRGRVAGSRWGLLAARAHGVVVSLTVIGGSLIGLVKSL